MYIYIYIFINIFWKNFNRIILILFNDIINYLKKLLKKVYYILFILINLY